ncbi:unnamed protein product [Linum trigynum]|uniref:Peptidoglycan binding-like domain-containing protein n=1 Tax=Linum trigynum TaxID=586398 RepID=A0AAV2CDX4_9ROSI
MSSSSSSSFLIPLNPPLSIIQRHKPPPSLPLLALYSKPSLHKSLVCHAHSSANSSDSDREEILWHREEQRWLREEQRWLREEQRWLRERELLLSEIQSLKLQIQALEKTIPVVGADAVPTNVGALLQVLKDRSLILESASSATPIILEENVEEEAATAESQAAGVVEVKTEETKSKKRIALRAGSEGEEVREMQEALQKLGFYSGEEDMEFSSFSSGTERAVKTWQATLGAPEDGIMSAELLERLYVETRTAVETLDSSADKKAYERSSLNFPLKGDENGTAVPLMTGISETNQKVVKDEGAKEVEASKHRVFLLGENRWEEPSLLIGRNKERTASKVTRTTKCLTCRGERRLMCTECDGTGEPNIEPQFLEWIGEDTKCAYCEGLGFITCDVCDGKTVS